MNLLKSPILNRNIRIAWMSFSLILAVLFVKILMFLAHGLPNPPVVLAGANIHYVAPSGNCNGATPCYTNIQSAVDSATSGDEIRVSGGTYTGLNNYGGFSQMVYISKTVTIIGGYSPGNWNTPTPDTNSTILDAQAQGRVLLITGNINPIIRHLHLTGGTSNNSAGGVFVSFSNATFENNVIESNTVTDGNGGGGLYSSFSNITLTNNIIRNNTSTTFNGGGGLILDNGTATLNNNSIIANTSSSYCGGMYLREVDATLNGNSIISNTAQTESGGGICLWTSDATFLNNIIADNQAALNGSGFFVTGSSPILMHNTIANNSGGLGEGIYVVDILGNFSSVNLINTILISQTTGIRVESTNTASLESTMWYGNSTNWAGTGTINRANDYIENPALSGDYHLTINSPAIDKGINTSANLDIDGDPRPIGDAPDIGADEATVATISPGQNENINFGNVEVDILAGSVTSTITIGYAPIDTVADTPPNFEFAGRAFSLDAYQNSTKLSNFMFEEPITVTIHYLDANVVGLIESTLELLYWNGNSWASDGIIVVERDELSNRLIATTSHLSDFALFGQQSEYAIYLPTILKTP